jgi:hypothetical protein
MLMPISACLIFETFYHFQKTKNNSLQMRNIKNLLTCLTAVCIFRLSVEKLGFCPEGI